MRALLPVLCLVAAVGAPSASASSPWGAVQDIATSAEFEAPISVAPDGRAVVAWTEYAHGARTAHLATRPPGGAWSAPTVVGDLGAHDLQVAATDADTTLGWDGTDGVHVATAAAGSAFGAPDLTDPDGSAPSVAVSHDGWTAVAWEDHTGPHAGTLAVAVRSPGGTFASPAHLPASTSFDTLSLADGGRAMVSWIAAGDPTRASVAIRDPSSGTWSPTQTAVTDRRGLWLLHGGISASGEVVLTWLSPDGTVRAATGTAGAWTAPQTIGYGSSQQVAVNAAGDAVLMWTDAGILRVARRGAGKPFGAPVSPPKTCTTTDAYPGPLQLDDQGDAALEWTVGLGTGVGAAIFDRSGALHPMPGLADGGRPIGPLSGGIDAAGVLTVLNVYGYGGQPQALRSVTTSASLADLAAAIPPASAHCTLPSGSRPVVPAALPAATAPALRLLKVRALHLRRGAVRVPVRCAGGSHGCLGSLAVRARGRRIGSLTFNLAPGARVTLTVPVTAPGRTRSVALVATTSLAGRTTVRTSATVPLRR